MSDNRTYGTLTSGPSDGQPAPDRIVVVRQRRARICSILVWTLCTLVAAAVLFLMLCIFAISATLTCTSIISPIPAPKNWSSFKNQSFAVGFDLTAGYGTAAITFENGTIINVGRVEGSPEYNSVMARLSIESSRHSSPPYYDCKSESVDLGRQWRRRARKGFGLPATSDVAALANVLAGLKAQTQALLGDLGPLELAFITVPPLPALYVQDLADAADHVKLQLLTLPPHIHRSGTSAQWPVSELNSAFAGNGFGVDRRIASSNGDLLHIGTGNGTSPNKPGKPEPWNDNVFSVLFTNTALTAHVLPISSAGHYYNAAGIANFSLGLASAHNSSAVSSKVYWKRIRVALRAGLDSYSVRGHQLGRVVSYGESAHNEAFEKILREEVSAAQASHDSAKQPQFASHDPIFAAARGAAVFARWCHLLPKYTNCFPDLRPEPPGW